MEECAMENVKKLEDMIQEWLKPLPHLPTEWRKWLSQNVWWITLIGVILSGFAVWGIYQAAVMVNQYTNFLNAVGVTNTVGWTLPMMVSIALFGLTAVIMAMAVGPLKEMKAKGWDLLFLSTLVSIAGSVFNYGSGSLATSIIGAVIGAIIGMYFLFEIRSYFKVKKEKA
jgi:hypothetical protein